MSKSNQISATAIFSVIAAGNERMYVFKQVIMTLQDPQLSGGLL